MATDGRDEGPLPNEQKSALSPMGDSIRETQQFIQQLMTEHRKLKERVDELEALIPPTPRPIRTGPRHTVPGQTGISSYREIVVEVTSVDDSLHEFNGIVQIADDTSDWIQEPYGLQEIQKIWVDPKTCLPAVGDWVPIQYYGNENVAEDHRYGYWDRSGAPFLICFEDCVHPGDVDQSYKLASMATQAPLPGAPIENNFSDPMKIVYALPGECILVWEACGGGTVYPVASFGLWRTFKVESTIVCGGEGPAFPVDTTGTTPPCVLDKLDDCAIQLCGTYRQISPEFEGSSPESTPLPEFVEAYYDSNHCKWKVSFIRPMPNIYATALDTFVCCGGVTAQIKATGVLGQCPWPELVTDRLQNHTATIDMNYPLNLNQELELMWDGVDNFIVTDVKRFCDTLPTGVTRTDNGTVCKAELNLANYATIPEAGACGGALPQVIYDASKVTVPYEFTMDSDPELGRCAMERQDVEIWSVCAPNILVNDPDWWVFLPVDVLETLSAEQNPAGGRCALDSEKLTVWVVCHKIANEASEEVIAAVPIALVEDVVAVQNPAGARCGLDQEKLIVWVWCHKAANETPELIIDAVPTPVTHLIEPITAGTGGAAAAMMVSPEQRRLIEQQLKQQVAQTLRKQGGAAASQASSKVIDSHVIDTTDVPTSDPMPALLPVVQTPREKFQADYRAGLAQVRDQACYSECTLCGDAPDLIDVTIAGIGNSACPICDFLNGIHTAVRVADCLWEVQVLNPCHVDNAKITVEFLDGGGGTVDIRVTLNAAPTFVIIWEFTGTVANPECSDLFGVIPWSSNPTDNGDCSNLTTATASIANGCPGDPPEPPGQGEVTVGYNVTHSLCWTWCCASEQEYDLECCDIGEPPEESTCCIDPTDVEYGGATMTKYTAATVPNICAGSTADFENTGTWPAGCDPAVTNVAYNDAIWHLSTSPPHLAGSGLWFWFQADETCEGGYRVNYLLCVTLGDTPQVICDTACCNTIIPTPDGDYQFGSIVYRCDDIDCVSCETGQSPPSSWQFTLAGVADGTCSDCTNMNRAWSVPIVAGEICEWLLSEDTFLCFGFKDIIISMDATGLTVTIKAASPATTVYVTYFLAGPIECEGANNVLNRTSQSGHCSWPATLTLTGTP